MDPKSAAKIDAFLVKLKKCLSVEEEFTLTLDDSSGNSFIENPHAPKNDPNMTIELYTRTPEQNKQLGFSTETPDFTSQEEKEDISFRDEVFLFYFYYQLNQL